MCTYLAKRGATYYFRRVIPAEIRPALSGKSEFMISLRTKDREEAKRRIPALTVQTDKEMDAARSASAEISPEKAAQRNSGTMTDREWAVFQHGLEGAEIGYQQMREKEERQDARQPLLNRLRQAVRKSTAEITPEEAAAHDLLREQAERLTAEHEKRIAEVVAKAEARRGLVPVSKVKSGVVVPLLETFDAYAAEQQLKPNTAYEWRRNIQALIDFLGHDDAAAISHDDLERWRVHLSQGVSKFGRPRSARTIKDKYFSTLRATLNWAVEKRKLSANVASEIVVRVPKKAKLRDRDFTDAEAKAILSVSLAATAGGISDEQALSRRWIPWLCAYTGARVNEIGQLRGSDVAQIDGVWTIRITPEAGTVKANEARVVPLHTHIVEQGFPAIAQMKGDAPIFYDPSRVRKPGAANRHVKKVGERLAEWVRDTVGITDPNIQPNHGWRHTFKTRAMEASVPERVADAIQGHAPKSVGQTYGSVSLRVMAEAIAKMPRFETDKKRVSDE